MNLSLVAGERSLDVLLVEDNPVNQKVVVSLLTKWGHRVVVAGDGAIGLEVLARQHIDLTLMDVQMPRMDGIEAMGRIRSREQAEGGHMPIIAITAHAASQDRVRCLAAGADRYMTKPLNSELLRKTMGELLSCADGESTSASSDAGTEPVDFEMLKECVGDDPDLLRDIVQIFLSDTPTSLETAARAIAAADAPAVEAAAHRLKGSLAVIGATSASETADLLESMGRDRQLEGSVALGERLQREVDAATECLRRWTARAA